jgi:hypothetical protein
MYGCFAKLTPHQHWNNDVWFASHPEFKALKVRDMAVENCGRYHLDEQSVAIHGSRVIP